MIHSPLINYRCSRAADVKIRFCCGFPSRQEKVKLPPVDTTYNLKKKKKNYGIKRRKKKQYCWILSNYIYSSCNGKFSVQLNITVHMNKTTPTVSVSWRLTSLYTSLNKKIKVQLINIRNYKISVWPWEKLIFTFE